MVRLAVGLADYWAGCHVHVQTSSKTKDGQIKRAAETIAKLKQQLKDSQTDREVLTHPLSACLSICLHVGLSVCLAVWLAGCPLSFYGPYLIPASSCIEAKYALHSIVLCCTPCDMHDPRLAGHNLKPCSIFGHCSYGEVLLLELVANNTRVYLKLYWL